MINGDDIFLKEVKSEIYAPFGKCSKIMMFFVNLIMLIPMSKSCLANNKKYLTFIERYIKDRRIIKE